MYVFGAVILFAGLSFSLGYLIGGGCKLGRKARAAYRWVRNEKDNIK